MQSKEEVSRTIIGVLGELLDSWGLSGEVITEETRLNADLCLSSVDMLEVMALIDVKFSRRFKYEELVVQDGHYRNELRVGEVADFVLARLDTMPVVAGSGKG
jgi:acyl carrier protein